MPLLTSPFYVIPSAGIGGFGPNGNNGVLGIHNLVTAGTIAAGTADPDFPVTNLANEATDLEWNAADTTTQYLTVNVSDYGDQVDYMGIAGHNLGSAGIAFSVEADDGGGYDEIIPSALLSDDTPILLRWEPGIYNAVRLKLFTGGTDPARIAVLYVGKLIVLPRRLYVGHTPITMGYAQNATNGQSESGNFLGRIITGASNQNSADLTNVPPSWMRSYFKTFMDRAKLVPFFFAWRPSGYPLEVGYVWLTSMPTPVNDRSNGFMKVTLAMRGIVA